MIIRRNIIEDFCLLINGLFSFYAKQKNMDDDSDTSEHEGMLCVPGYTRLDYLSSLAFDISNSTKLNNVTNWFYITYTI